VVVLNVVNGSLSLGTGKSTFINSFLGLKPNDPGAAAVGTNECTTEISPYANPTHPQLILHDAPGVGVKRWPRATYIERLAVNEYDAFVLMVSYPRIFEHDAWLLKELQKLGKRVFLVRSKFDSDVEDSQVNQSGLSRQEIKDKLIAYVREEMDTSERVYVTGRAQDYSHLEEDFSELLRVMRNVSFDI
jgi:GTPase Era involved in 16S rRNA processing